MNSHHQETDPAVVTYKEECRKETERGARKGHVKVENERKKKRMSMRLEALEKWESLKTGESDTAPDVLWTMDVESNASGEGEC